MTLNNLMQNTFLFVGMVVCSFYLVTYYIIHALFLYKTAKREDVGMKIFAWIPIVNIFYTGAIAEKIYPLQRFVSQMLSTVIASACIGFAGYTFQLKWIWFFGWIPALIFAIIYYMATYRIYQELDPKNGTVLLLLNIVFSLARLITRIYMLMCKMSPYERKRRKDYMI